MDLVNRYLMLHDLDGEVYTISRFCERLGKYLYLMESLSPHDGTILDDGLFLVDVRSLQLGPEEDPCFSHARFFNDQESLWAFIRKMNGPPRPIAKLVRPEIGKKLEPEPT